MTLSPALRERLAKPFGEVVPFEKALARLKEKRPPLLVAVGDQIVVNLLQAGLRPDIAVYDNICQRKEVPREWGRQIQTAALREGGSVRAPNPPGGVSPQMEARVRDLLSIGSGWLEIDGEDDLASLVVMAHAPAGGVLLYGQPNAGVVWVQIQAEIHNEALGLLAEIKRR